jgi:hypothetical protein
MIKILILSVVLLGIAFLALSIKLLVNKKAEFKAGCASASPELEEKGFGCGCGGACSS